MPARKDFRSWSLDLGIWNFRRDAAVVLGGGLEPPRLTAYAPQTYVSAISPPELGSEDRRW
jgi:hypothetical protein